MNDHASRVDVEDVYELSPMQLGMLFQTLLAPGSDMFVEQQISQVFDTLQPSILERAWNAVIESTPVLRTSFHWRDIEHPLQAVHRHASLAVEYLDIAGLEPDAAAAEFAEFVDGRRQSGFDLERPPLVRVALVKVGPHDARLVWQFHHMLLDGWSAPLVLHEVMKAYAAIATGQRYRPSARRPYRTYIDWLQHQDRDAAERFWRAELEGFTSPTPLDIGTRPRVSTASRASDRVRDVTISPGDSDRLRTFARQNRLTLNTVVQGAWALLLSRYSQQTDLVFGAVVSGRPPDLVGVEEMIGLFINTLPVRVQIHPDDRLVPWLLRVQQRQFAASPHHHVSMLDIQRWTGLPSGTRLYDSVLIFENFPVLGGRPGARPDGNEPVCVGRADVALSVVVMPGRTLRLQIVYDGTLFEDESIERLARHFVTVLCSMPADPQQRLADIVLVTPAERHRMLVEWNATGSPGFDRVPLMKMLDDQATRTPEAVAFVDEGICISMRTVHERSNQLARYLGAQGVGVGTVVGVCGDRSLDAVIAFLAILKCRAAFLPLDASYPRERLAYMVADAKASLVIGLDASLATSSRVLDWPTVRQGASREACDSPDWHAVPDDLAYIIYTSGSTGQPKGVAVEHRAILNRLSWMWREYPFAVGDVGAMKTALNFVDAFWEMLGPLLRGVPSVIVPARTVSDPEAFVELLRSHSVTRLFFVPSFLEMLLERYSDLGVRLPALRSWWSGGEPLSVDLYRRFRKAVPGAALFNVFGASELWDATLFDPQRHGPVRESVPIGTPIANTEAYILDRDRQPVPVGALGTLFIGGSSLARGYVGQAARLSAQSFVPHPFSNTPGARLYDTGDLARFRADGLIEYVGRRDFQLKVRGFRVEPAEIEALLEAHPLVRESIVVRHAPDPGDQRLLAYIVPLEAAGPRDTEVLLMHLRDWLPVFMVPTIVWIDAIPRTPSGKRDRNRLPHIASTSAPRSSRREAATPLEHIVIREFRAVLGRDDVGLDDDFFADLGGHSLLATRLMSRIRDRIGLDVPVRTVFDAPTAAALAAILASQPLDGAADVETASILSELSALPLDEAEALLASMERPMEGGEQ